MPGFSGQGKIYIGSRQGDGSPGILRWLGNASIFRISQNEDTVERKESYTGNRLPNRRMTRGRGGELSITFDEFNKENMAFAMLGQSSAVAAGATVTNEALPQGLVVGDTVLLANKNISVTSLIDSTSGTPKTLTLNTHFSLDDFGGSVTILNLTAGGPYVQPFKANYSVFAHHIIGAFKLLSPEFYIRMDGVNTDDGSRAICDVFRTRLSPSKQIDLINDDFNDFELSGSVLADLLRSSASAGGQFYSLTLP